MRTLRAVERALLSAEKAVLIVFVLIMISLSFLQVILRGAFSGGFLWADTFLRHLVLWVGFLGAAVAASENKQFAMDAASRALKGRVKAGLEAAACVFTAAVCGVMTKASWAFLMEEKAMGGTLFSIGESVHVPTWHVEIILPAGFALILVHYLIKTVRCVHELATGRS